MTIPITNIKLAGVWSIRFIKEWIRGLTKWYGGLRSKYLMILRCYNIFIDNARVVFNRLLYIIEVYKVLGFRSLALLSYIIIIIYNITFKGDIIINNIII